MLLLRIPGQCTYTPLRTGPRSVLLDNVCTIPSIFVANFSKAAQTPHLSIRSTSKNRWQYVYSPTPTSSQLWLTPNPIAAKRISCNSLWNDSNLYETGWAPITVVLEQCEKQSYMSPLILSYRVHPCCFHHRNRLPLLSDSNWAERIQILLSHMFLKLTDCFFVLQWLQ